MGYRAWLQLEPCVGLVTLELLSISNTLYGRDPAGTAPHHTKLKGFADLLAPPYYGGLKPLSL